MSNQLRRVMLIDGDPMVLEGLKLLLQDLQCEVMVLRNYQDLQQLSATNDDCPKLIITPEALEDGISGEHLINELRSIYKSSIPTILLTDGLESDKAPFDQPEQIFLCGDLNPSNLRKMITHILDRAIMPE